MSTTTRPHPHAAVIKAWADGAPIQCRRDSGDLWVDYIEAAGAPPWRPDWQYRVKPTNVERYIPVIRSPSGGVLLQVTKPTREEAYQAHFGNSGLAGIIRVEINPETMELVSARMERP